MKEVNAVKVMNDYVAVIKHLDIPDGIDIDKSQIDKLSNEGTIVGVGPTASNRISIGRRVIFRRGQYMTIKPVSGDYEGKDVCIMKETDLLVDCGMCKTYKVNKSLEE